MPNYYYDVSQAHSQDMVDIKGRMEGKEPWESSAMIVILSVRSQGTSIPRRQLSYTTSVPSGSLNVLSALLCS